ncbi:MAG: TetR/AcrR family transcriptional regulator [Synergistaceae bacterium]|jgi:AcrR family transcriptional regulator|nr:TetR/AcrR family transcriptional regulator [Synergistaceae bacterium]
MRQNKRQIQKEATRKKLIETAMRVYSRDGFSAPSSVIAEEAGVAHGTLFVHFPTLNDLLHGALQKFFIQIGGKLHDLSEKGGDLGEFLRTHLEILESVEAFYKKLVTECYVLPMDARVTLASIQAVVSKHFAAAAAVGIKEGTIKDIPPEVMFNIWLALVHYYIQNSDILSPGESALRKFKDEMTDNFAELIRRN